MRNQDCVGFLQWCLPGLGLRWRGFRKVRIDLLWASNFRKGSLGELDASKNLDGDPKK